MYSLYLKPYKNPTDLIIKLKSQNLIISDEPKASVILSKINYFRFKIYLRPFLDIAIKQFRANSKFEDAYQLYSFDEELKNILFSIISQIEINLRTKLDQYVTSYTNNPFWYLDNQYFSNESKNFTTKVSLKNEFLRSQDDFTLHYKENYKNIFVIDIEQAFCDKDYCYGVKNEKMLYADDDHLSIEGSIHQAKFIIKKIDNAN